MTCLVFVGKIKGPHIVSLEKSWFRLLSMSTMVQHLPYTEDTAQSSWRTCFVETRSHRRSTGFSAVVVQVGRFWLNPVKDLFFRCGFHVDKRNSVCRFHFHYQESDREILSAEHPAYLLNVYSNPWFVNQHPHWAYSHWGNRNVVLKHVCKTSRLLQRSRKLSIDLPLL